MGVYLLMEYQQDKGTDSSIILQLDPLVQLKTQILVNTYNAMPNLMQVVVLLHYYDRISIPQLAQMLNCPPETVKILLEKASILFQTAVNGTNSRGISSMLEYLISSFSIPTEVIERIQNAIVH